MNESTETTPATPDTINLGDIIEDSITGLRGTAVARVDWLNGCRRYVIQPKEVKDGQPVEVSTIDVHTLRVVERAHQPSAAKQTGGPIATPPSQPHVSNY